MGYRISYIATTVPPKDLVNSLGFGLDVETDALPYDEWWVGTLKSNGMTIFWSEAEDFVNSVTKELAALSQAGPVYACTVNETVMFAGVTCYRDGQEQWQVTWQGEDGPVPENLLSGGDIPTAFAELAEKARTSQAQDPEVDHFWEVPLELIAAESGFRHDIDMINANFSRFYRINAETPKTAKVSKPSFFQRLFGR